MIDQRSNNKVVDKKTDNAFVRDELNGAMLIVPKGYTQNESLVINKVGREILDIIDGKRTILDIINTLSKRYRDVPYSRIQNDVYIFIDNMLKVNLVKFMEVDNMYNGKTVDNLGEYEIFRCSEGDFKVIQQILNSKSKVLDVFNAPIDESNYDPLSLRTKIFNYYEDFYLLQKDGKACALVSIITGRNMPNKVPALGRFITLENISKENFAQFIKKCLDNYKKEIDKECIKARFTMISSNEGENSEIGEVMKLASFDKVAVFKDEYGKNSNQVIFDYYFVA
ncbi:MAG: PqqD family protein [Clostridiaceae bacterium]|nr:PqqD family protein [Clostridiaceae bacterium]